MRCTGLIYQRHDNVVRQFLNIIIGAFCGHIQPQHLVALVSNLESRRGHGVHAVHRKSYWGAVSKNMFAQLQLVASLSLVRRLNRCERSLDVDAQWSSIIRSNNIDAEAFTDEFLDIYSQCSFDHPFQQMRCLGLRQRIFIKFGWRRHGVRKRVIKEKKLLSLTCHIC
jgi:hypothetical protein